MVRELQSGPTFEEEIIMMQKGMRAVTSINKGKPPTIEVITYRKGFADLFGEIVDVLRRKRANQYPLRGHTTLVINDYTYSFELNWVAGYTKDQYLGTTYNRKRWHTGHIQTLRVDPKDIARLQDYMLSLVGREFWGIKGEVCTSSTGKALQRIMNVQSTYSPIGFQKQLHESGLVIRTYPTPFR